MNKSNVQLLHTALKTTITAYKIYSDEWVGVQSWQHCFYVPNATVSITYTFMKNAFQGSKLKKLKLKAVL